MLIANTRQRDRKEYLFGLIVHSTRTTRNIAGSSIGGQNSASAAKTKQQNSPLSFRHLPGAECHVTFRQVGFWTFIAAQEINSLSIHLQASSLLPEVVVLSRKLPIFHKEKSTS